ncbi:hypothetical protein Lalb_Chr08g0230341 [Lupinus albus]|uniref:Uncharacterized protein n=1 Tax=Lupinus albus TaxID=3870 RepID=A0A6A4Q1W5_LUPAL|nr:hypothetical protein Lalb_Chr08g0230341 [Lupinus albus]
MLRELYWIEFLLSGILHIGVATLLVMMSYMFGVRVRRRVFIIFPFHVSSLTKFDNFIGGWGLWGCYSPMLNLSWLQHLNSIKGSQVKGVGYICMVGIWSL